MLTTSLPKCDHADDAVVITRVYLTYAQCRLLLVETQPGCWSAFTDDGDARCDDVSRRALDGVWRNPLFRRDDSCLDDYVSDLLNSFYDWVVRGQEGSFKDPISRIPVITIVSYFEDKKMPFLVAVDRLAAHSVNDEGSFVWQRPLGCSFDGRGFLLATSNGFDQAPEINVDFDGVYGNRLFDGVYGNRLFDGNDLEVAVDSSIGFLRAVAGSTAYMRGVPAARAALAEKKKKKARS